MATLTTLDPSLAQSPGKTLGLTFDEWNYALYELPGAAECPDGLQISDLDMFRNEYKTEEQQNEALSKHGFYLNRGPQGENDWLFPQLVQEPVPYREGKRAKSRWAEISMELPTERGRRKLVRIRSSPIHRGIPVSTTRCTESWDVTRVGRRAAFCPTSCTIY